MSYTKRSLPEDFDVTNDNDELPDPAHKYTCLYCDQPFGTSEKLIEHYKSCSARLTYIGESSSGDKSFYRVA